jgi:hypothetical protein
MIVPHAKAGGDHNVPQHKTASFEVAKRVMEAIIFRKTHWQIISDENYLTVDNAWKLAIEAPDCQRALAGTPVGAPSRCQLPGGQSLKIDLQTQKPVSECAVFCFSIRLIII